MHTILLVRPNIEIASENVHPVNVRPPYILKYIQALLGADGCRTVYFLDAYARSYSGEELFRSSQKYDPDILVVYSSFQDFKGTCQYVKDIKAYKPTAVVIVVGPGPSVVPGIYLNNPDISHIFRGECELHVFKVLKELLARRSVNSGRDIGTIFQIDEPEGLPFLHFSDDEFRQYRMLYPIRTWMPLKWGHILSTRGCPYACIFCSAISRDSYGKKLRMRSAKNTVDEIEQQVGCGVNIVSFDDDNFTTSRDHVVSVCNEVLARKLRVKWIAHARVDNDLSAETLALMKKAGCCLLRFGVEAGSQRIIEVLKKTDQPQWRERVAQMFSAVHAAGIQAVALFIIGNPGETKEEINETISLAKRIRPDLIQISFFVAYPGSDFYAEKMDERSIEESGCLYHYAASSVATISQIPRVDLERIYISFYKEVFFDFMFLLRHVRNYFGFYLMHPAVVFKFLHFIHYLKVVPYADPSSKR